MQIAQGCKNCTTQDLLMHHPRISELQKNFDGTLKQGYLTHCRTIAESASFKYTSWKSVRFCCRRRREKKGKERKVTSRLYFTNIWSRPPWTDFHKNWQGCRGQWRNQSDQVWLQYLGYTGVSDLQGVKISVFLLTLMVIVTTVLQLPRSLWYK